MQLDFSTPMMKQYLAIKKKYPDCLLFYRMGDFYELFLDDAHIGAKILNITLTGKSNGKNTRIPMAGVPYHAVDSYLFKLVKAGYKVAICEQLSPPNKKGLVERDVVRVVTPGTMLDEKHLSQKNNNYIICLDINKNLLAIAIADLSTGYFSTKQIETENTIQTLNDELSRINPVECILSNNLYNNPQILNLLRNVNCNCFVYHDWDKHADNAKNILKEHFKVTTLEGFGITKQDLAMQASAILLAYLKETQKNSVGHIKKIIYSNDDDNLVLDRSTIINLELFSTIREHNTRGSLLNVLDNTSTSMGGRLIKQWLLKPLTNKKEIAYRHDAVEELFMQRKQRVKLQETIKNINDIERLISRLTVGLGNGRDLINLKNSLRMIIDVKKILNKSKSELLTKLNNKININNSLERLCKYIENNIVPEPPISLREGGIVQSGINKQLDELRKIVGGSKEWILEMEQKEKENTGINSLKVRFNQVFGFYIEISKTNLNLVPKNYIRKQTLVNGERFITPELKSQEEIILSAEEKINDLEYQLFQEILINVLKQTDIIQLAADSIAQIDCLINFANLAEKNNYVRPKILYSGEIRIKNGRHPVVEKLLEETQFVPNDTTLDNISQQLLLITGPNMAGKSVFIRQVAIIILMNQIGSFVPAEKAYLSLFDRIFVRSGASDIITSGLSTFMVEMVETANILNHSTKNSLIIMDEIGRGTSTYDGISIAWAVAEYLIKNNSAKTLFATHYHELQVLEEQYPKQIRNFHMGIADNKEKPVFLHTILPGGSSHSFGVAVAKLAGIPEQVINRANELLKELEKRNPTHSSSRLFQVLPDDSGSVNASQNEVSRLTDHLIHKELEKIDIANMTPLDALNKLSELKDKLKLFTMQDKELLHAD